MAPRKVRLLADLIRGMRVVDAMIQLKFSRKHAAKEMITLLRSAVANAEHNANIDADTLVITESYVNGGPILYRWMPRAFGRASKIRKRTSHVVVVLEGEEKVAKNTKKKTDKVKNIKKTKNAKDLIKEEDGNKEDVEETTKGTKETKTPKQ